MMGEKMCIQFPEEEHGEKKENFFKTFKGKWDVDWELEGCLEVDEGDWSAKASPTQSNSKCFNGGQ